MEVEIISNEIIKPSSPTPDHLRQYKLSFLDQLIHRAYNPFVYYYAFNDQTGDHESNTIADISLKLKKSLSETLTLYYPLAGRFVDDRVLDCNDAGAPFLTARVPETKLSDVLKNPFPRELNKLLPFEQDEVGEPLVGVKLNVFACGGIAVGVCVSHGIADALSTLVFIKSWMAIARGEPDAAPCPKFVAAELFPPRNVRGFNPSLAIMKKETVRSRVFFFEGSRVESLKKKYSRDGKFPSRVVALTAFICSRLVAVTSASGTFPVINQPVNIRPKLDPPLPEHAFGNFLRRSLTVPMPAETEPELAQRLGEEIRKVDKEALESFRSSGDEVVDSFKKGLERLLSQDIEMLIFSSLCRFPVYEADFGLGKPIWVSLGERCLKNRIVFMDNNTGDGILAHICLTSQVMAKLEADQEFLGIVSRL